jgi:hypothetical protein
MVRARSGSMAVGRSSGRKVITDQESKADISKAVRELTGLEKETLGKIVGLLEAEPERIFELWARLTSSEAKKAKPADKTKWNQTYCYWRQISKAWLGNLVAELGKDFGLTVKIMEDIDAADKDNVPRLCTLFWGFHPDELFPRPCLDRLVMKEYLTKVGDKLGSRWERLMSSKAVKDDGTIDWNLASPFTFKWEGGLAVSIHHDLMSKWHPVEIRLAESAVGKLDQTWTLTDLCDDRLAAVSKQMLHPKLHEFFMKEQVNDFMSLFDPEILGGMAKQIADRMSSKTDTLDILERNIFKKGELKKQEERTEKAKQRKPPKSTLTVKMSVPGGEVS